MADPDPYVPSYSFSGWQAVNPTKPLPGGQIDNELANVSQSIETLVSAVQDVRRSDGALQNGIVTADSLAPDVVYQISADLEAAVTEAAGSATASAASAAASLASAGDAQTWAEQAASGSAIMLSLTRADIPFRTIPLLAFMVSGNTAPGDLGSGAVYVRGTSSGPRAVQDAAGTWWNLSYGPALNAGHFGANGDGIADDADALDLWWATLKAGVVQPYVGSLPLAFQSGRLPAGTYRVTRPLNWTSLRAWNVFIDATGAIISGEVNGKSIIEMLDNRGVHVRGLAVMSPATATPKSGILFGPKNTDTCGNNKLEDVKILGQFSIAAMHNIGSETTLYDMCYFVNRTGKALAADGLHILGAVSDHVSLRTSGVAVSFTNNFSRACRFENSDTSAPALNCAVYIEGTNGHEFDRGCYFLAFSGANIEMVDRSGTYRNSSIHIAGLFETNQGPGVEYVVRMRVGGNTAISGFVLDAQSPHAKTGIIRVEDMAGANLTSTTINIRNAAINIDGTPYNPAKIFDGARIGYVGDIICRSGSIINVVDLLQGYGTICCDDASTIPSTVANSAIAFDVLAGGVLGGQGLKMGGTGGAWVGIQGGTHPRVRAVSDNANADLWLEAQGTGNVRFGTLTANADAPVTGYITIKDGSGTARKIAVIT